MAVAALSDGHLACLELGPPLVANLLACRGWLVPPVGL